MPKFKYEKSKDFTIMSNYHFRDKRLSFKAVGLLSFMLSVPDSWDWSVAGLVKIRRDGKDSVSSAIKELEDCGYLERVILRDTNGRFLDVEYNIYELPKEKTVETVDNSGGSVDNTPPFSVKPTEGKSKSGEPKTENPPAVQPTAEKHPQSNIKQSKNQKVKIKKSNTDLIKNQSNQSADSPNDGDSIDKIDYSQTERKIKENISYGSLCQRYGKARSDEIVSLMLEIMCSGKPLIRVAREEYPAEMVKERIEKLRYDNIEYVFGCMDKTTAKINNIKNYLKTALFNSGATIDAFYTAEANHDISEKFGR